MATCLSYILTQPKTKIVTMFCQTDRERKKTLDIELENMTLEEILHTYDTARHPFLSSLEIVPITELKDAFTQSPVGHTWVNKDKSLRETNSIGMMWLSGCYRPVDFLQDLKDKITFCIMCSEQTGSDNYMIDGLTVLAHKKGSGSVDDFISECMATSKDKYTILCGELVRAELISKTSMKDNFEVLYEEAMNRIFYPGVIFAIPKDSVRLAMYDETKKLVVSKYYCSHIECKYQIVFPYSLEVTCPDETIEWRVE